MRQFGAKLDYANFYGNNITFLDEDLFEYNQNKKYVGLGGNPIKFIDPEFTTNLKNFKMLANINFGDVCLCMFKLHFKWNDENCRNYEPAKDYMKTLF